MLRRIFHRQSELGTVEYGIVLMLVALILVASMSVLGDLLNLLFA